MKTDETVQLRLATVDDAAAMLAIYAPYVEETTVTFEYETPSLAEFAARFAAVAACFPWYAAVCGGEVVGYAYADRAFARAAYQWDADLSIYLAPAAKGRGAGRALYARLESDLQAMGYCTAYALVTGENAASAAFHRSLGYALRAVLPAAGYKQGRWLDLYWYEKALCDKPQQPVAPLPFSALAGK